MDNNHTTAVDNNRVINLNCSSCAEAPLDPYNPISSEPSHSSPPAFADGTLSGRSESSDTDPSDSCSTSGTDMDNNHTTAVDNNRVILACLVLVAGLLAGVQLLRARRQRLQHHQDSLHRRALYDNLRRTVLEYDRALRDRDRGRCKLARIDWTRPKDCYPEQFSRSSLRHKRRETAAYHKIRAAATAAAHRRLAPKIRAAMVITAAAHRYLAPLHITAAYIQHHARIFLFRRRHAACIIQRRACRFAAARLKRKHFVLRRRLESTKQKFATKMPQLTDGPHVTNNIAMLLFPIMVATRGQDARQCAALQKVLMGRLLRMESSSDIAQNVMVTIVYGGVEAELNAYFRKGNTNTTYFTRLAQCLGNYLKGVEALCNDLSAMYVNDVDKDLSDRFPAFAGAVEDLVSKTCADPRNVGLFASSEESDEEDDELDYDPWTGLDRAPRQEEHDGALDDGEYDGEYDEHGFLIDGMGD